MNTRLIQTLTVKITSYAPYAILLLNNIGCLGSFLTLTSKRFRQNSCGWYFLLSTVFDFLFVNFGLWTKLADLSYGSTLKNTNLIWCRSRSYLTWTLPCISTSFIVLASIDRCLSTSRNVRLRSFSQLKIAYRMTCIPIIVYSLTTSHQLFYYQLQPVCMPSLGIYAYFLSFYSIIWTSLIPEGLMLIFGLITYYNVRTSRQRVIFPRILQRNRADFQLIKITLFQVLSSFILLNIRTIYFTYVLFSMNRNTTFEYDILERLILELTSFCFYLNFSKSFYINLLTSQLFRRVFRERVNSIYQRNRIHIHPGQ